MLDGGHVPQQQLLHGPGQRGVLEDHVNLLSPGTIPQLPGVINIAEINLSRVRYTIGKFSKASMKIIFYFHCSPELLHVTLCKYKTEFIVHVGNIEAPHLDNKE